MNTRRIAFQPVTNAIVNGVKRNYAGTSLYAQEGIDYTTAKFFAKEAVSPPVASDQPQTTVCGSTFLRNLFNEFSGPVPQNLKILEQFRALVSEGNEAWARVATDEDQRERSQSIMYAAWGAFGKRRVRLARKALRIDRDCADAYVLLAQEATYSLKEAKALFESGVRAGEAILKAIDFKPAESWQNLKTRPYMRARLGLAECLWQLGEREAAIAHASALIELNPADNQGIRWRLFSWLLAEKQYDKVAKLLKLYQADHSAMLSFSRALYEFSTKRSGLAADALLREALRVNEHVAVYLLNQRELPEVMPYYVEVGNEAEAIEYALMAKQAWQETEDAIAWLAKIVEGVSARKKHPASRLWQEYLEAGDRARAEGKYKKAKGHYRYALGRAEKFGDDEVTALTLNRLCTACLEGGAEREDEPHFVRLVMLTEAIFGAEAPKLGYVLYHQALLHREFDRWGEAETGLVRSLQILEEYEPESDLLTPILEELSVVYARRGKPELAQEAKERAKKLVDDSAPELEEVDENTLAMVG